MDRALPLAVAPPWWIGTLALVSFLAVFAVAGASAFHIIVGPSAAVSEAIGAPQNTVSQEEATGKAPAEPQPAVIRRNAKSEFAAVRMQPKDGALIDRLPAGYDVQITKRDGDWFEIQYQRDADVRLGWTHKVNLFAENGSQ